MDRKRLHYDAQLSMEWMQQYRPLFTFLIVAYALFVISVRPICKGRRSQGMATIIFVGTPLMRWRILSCFLPYYLIS
ncbi:hypothetical protein QQG55_44795 [Brugia pahangi]